MEINKSNPVETNSLEANENTSTIDENFLANNIIIKQEDGEDRAAVSSSATTFDGLKTNDYSFVEESLEQVPADILEPVNTVQDVELDEQEMAEINFYKYDFILNNEVADKDSDPEIKQEDDEFGCTEIWKALDELTLLEGVKRYGMGSWKEIAQLLAPSLNNITPEQVESHFRKHFINGIMGQVFWKNIYSQEIENLTYHTNENQKMPVHENAKWFNEVTPTQLETIAYLPKRDDFEREYDNDNECLIAYIPPGNDDELKQKLKDAQLELYEQRLKERFRKKSIVHHYELVVKFFKNLNSKLEANSGKVKKEELDTSESRESSLISLFLRFCQKDELKSLFTDLQKEFYLKFIIRELIKYKKLGFTNLKEVEQFENTQLSNQAQRVEKTVLKEDSEAGPETNKKRKLTETSSVSISSSTSDPNALEEEQSPYLYDQQFLLKYVFDTITNASAMDQLIGDLFQQANLCSDIGQVKQQPSSELSNDEAATAGSQRTGPIWSGLCSVPKISFKCKFLASIHPICSIQICSPLQFVFPYQTKKRG